VKTSSAFKKSRTRTMMGTFARKHPKRIPLIEARRVTHSSPPIVLVLELVLDPIVEFLLKSPRVHPVAVGVLLQLLNSES
jgi:hypothetical protein